MIKVLLVDDEENAREALTNLLKKHSPEVKIVGKAASANEGAVMISEVQPDLVFLDIEMPGGSGFEMLRKIPAINFDIIFTTAFDQYAIQAMRFSAVDYLLKPVDPDELSTAIKKVANKRQVQLDAACIESLLQNLQYQDKAKKRLAISHSQGVTFIPLNTIIRCQSDNNYTIFYLDDNQKVLASRNLKEYESLLTDYGFYRIHQSHLINLDKVRELKRNDDRLIMSDGSKVNISRRRKDGLIERLMP